MNGEHILFGRPYAPAGEDRPRRFCTPLGWAEGADGGVLLVQDGPYKSRRRWILWSEWIAWVEEVKAAPAPHPPVPGADDPWAPERQDEKLFRETPGAHQWTAEEVEALRQKRQHGDPAEDG